LLPCGTQRLENQTVMDASPLMTIDQQCPACSGKAITAGQFFGRRPLGFLPAGLRFWTTKARPIAFSASGPLACTACGLVWLRVEAALLRQVIREAGRHETPR
jgi:hypothetical protein